MSKSKKNSKILLILAGIILLTNYVLLAHSAIFYNKIAIQYTGNALFITLSIFIICSINYWQENKVDLIKWLVSRSLIN